MSLNDLLLGRQGHGILEGQCRENEACENATLLTDTSRNLYLTLVGMVLCLTTITDLRTRRSVATSEQTRWSALLADELI